MFKLGTLPAAAAAQEEGLTQKEQPGAAAEQPETEQPGEEGGDGDPGKANSPPKETTPNQVNGQVRTNLYHF